MKNHKAGVTLLWMLGLLIITTGMGGLLQQAYRYWFVDRIISGWLIFFAIVMTLFLLSMKWNICQKTEARQYSSEVNIQ